MTVYIPSPNVAIRSIPPGWANQRDALRIAAFSCRGLEDLSRELGFPVAVVAAVPDTDHHRFRLRDLWYASGVPMGYSEWCAPFDFDDWLYRDWSKLGIDGRWFGDSAHPLAGSVDDGDLLLRLPAGASRRAFSNAFRDGLADLRFEAVARQPANCVRRHHGRRALAVKSRYARASAADPTPVEVRDVVHFEPRTLTRVADVALAALRASVIHLDDAAAARCPAGVGAR